MPVNYVIDKKRRLVLTSGEGSLTFSEIRSHQDRLISDPDFDPAFNQLIDTTRSTAFDISAEEAREIANRAIFSPTSRRAFLASQPSIYGIGRMMQAYHEPLAQVAIFYDRASALEWLGIEETPVASENSN